MKIICRIGCTGLLTDVPLMVAQAKGYFAEADVSVVLSVELGWASIELKLTKGQLSAANVPPSFPVLVCLNQTGGILPMHALAITSYHGEAISLNQETATAFQSGKHRTLKTIKIGVDAPHSLSPNLVRSWLKSLGTENLPTIQLVPMAMSQLLDLLQDGYIQGFCGAEPLSQIAAEKNIGLTVARSRDHPPLQIQSVLVATNEFFTEYPAESKAITAAINRARIYCMNPKHEAEILHIYRKHLLNKKANSSAPLGGSDQSPTLATLIGFEPATAKPKDQLAHLTKACATFPRVTAGERIVRDTITKIFSSVY